MSRAIHLIHQWASGQLTPEEEGELAALLSSGNAESEAALELLQVEAMLRGELLDLDVAEAVVNEIQRHQADDAARKIFGRIADNSDPGRTGPPPRRSSPHPWRRTSAMAATVLLIIGAISWTILRPSRSQDHLTSEGPLMLDTEQGLVEYDPAQGLPWGTRIATGASPRTHVRLHDGSDIEMASQTTFAVTREQSAVRVDLSQGQIVARIAKQRPGQRFAVRTPCLSVEVVGTRFTVNHLDGISTVSVDEGSVDVVLAQEGRRERLSGGQDLAASKSGIITGPVQEYWHEDFEQGKLARWWSSGTRVDTADAPPGNNSRGCLKATEERDEYYKRDLLVARMSNTDSGLFLCDDSLVVRFKYHAAPSCGWVGIWMQAASGARYFLPIESTLGTWQTAEARLQDARSSTDPEAPMPLGEVIQVMIFQAERTSADSVFYLDDLSINRSPPSPDE